MHARHMIRNATRNLIAACIHIYSQAINKLMYQAIFLQYKPQQLDVASFQLQVKKKMNTKIKNKKKCHLHTINPFHLIYDEASGEKKMNKLKKCTKVGRKQGETFLKKNKDDISKPIY